MHSPNKLSKTPYQSPKLFVYGDIRELTRGQSIPTSIGDNPSQPPTLPNQNKSVA
ncbi:lasso RiPP family leader peptide-containing protein [Floridanema evergladense]|uniref:Lasso RiPP family leader peptide-containing protein n=1 Tax=Floridaenema evergladense BLCC-F167 TaxID=3153639 RepID=A0ABV4WJL0_9CYAN